MSSLHCDYTVSSVSSASNDYRDPRIKILMMQLAVSKQLLGLLASAKNREKNERPPYQRRRELVSSEPLNIVSGYSQYIIKT